MRETWDLTVQFSAEERVQAEDLFKLLFKMVNTSVTTGVAIKVLMLRPVEETTS
jgi:hypothetical protein